MDANSRPHIAGSTTIRDRFDQDQPPADNSGTARWLHFAKVAVIIVTPILAPIAFGAGLTVLGIICIGAFLISAASYCGDKYFTSEPDPVNTDVMPEPGPVDIDLTPESDSVDIDLTPGSDSVDIDLTPGSDSVDIDLPPKSDPTDFTSDSGLVQIRAMMESTMGGAFMTRLREHQQPNRGDLQPLVYPPLTTTELDPATPTFAPFNFDDGQTLKPDSLEAGLNKKTGESSLADNTSTNNQTVASEPSVQSPTDQQITLVSQKIFGKEIPNCAVCLEAVKFPCIKLNCGHFFDQDCIETHFNTEKVHAHTPTALLAMLDDDEQTEFIRNFHYYEGLAGTSENETGLDIYMSKIMSTQRINQLKEMRRSDELLADQNAEKLKSTYNTCPQCSDVTQTYITYKNIDDTKAIPHPINKIKNNPGTTDKNEKQ